MKIKMFGFLAIASLLLSIAISPLRGFISFRFSSIAGFVIYLLFTAYCVQKHKKNISSGVIFTAIILGMFIVQIPVRVRFFSESLISLPDFALHLLGALSGFSFSFLKPPLRYVFTLPGLAIALFMFFQGYDLWVHKLNFGSYTGNVFFRLPARFEALDQKNTLITNDDFSGKIVLMDFWHTRCGACFKKFPELQKVFNHYKNNSSVLVLAVNKPLEDDPQGQAFRMIKEEGYDFPVVVTKNENLPELYGVEVYPTTLILNQQGTVIFKGRLEEAQEQIKKIVNP